MSDQRIDTAALADVQIAKAEARLRIWDAPTRLFHWSIVTLIAVSWISIKFDQITLHLVSGSALLALLLFRLTWGLFGATTARFVDFVRGPRSVAQYFAALRRGETPVHAGHNPAGGWMVMGLIGLLLLQVLTGFAANDDRGFRGPLAGLVSKDISDILTVAHGYLFVLLMCAVWMHVVAILFYLLVRAENLIWPMLVGTKPASQVPADHVRIFPHPVRALGIALAAGTLVWWIVVS